MLSYMVPSLEEKPPPGRPRRTIIKTHSNNSALSQQSSATSISSVLSEIPNQDSKQLLSKNNINGNTKHPTLKRVSFGSSKGSMVETLIYESPLQEEPEPLSDSGSGASRVRVSFFESDRPLAAVGAAVEGPHLPAELLLLHSDLDMSCPLNHTSNESGWENPFRPDGELSREADEIVQLIRVGKPITPTCGGGRPVSSADVSVATSAWPALHNGSSPAPPAPQTDLVLRTTAAPPAQAEHVTIKKKPKSKCCVIQ